MNIDGVALKAAQAAHRPLPRPTLPRLAAWATPSTAAITGTRHATNANSNAVTPANVSGARRPKCSPSQPPNNAPGPAGNRINQRMTLVMRPNKCSGVTAWRMDKKLMKMNTAPIDHSSNIKANEITPHAHVPSPTGARASSNQPLPHKANPNTKHGPGPKRRLARWPSMLANTDPTPVPTKLKPMACSLRPKLRVANKICTTIAAF